MWIHMHPSPGVVWCDCFFDKTTSKHYNNKTAVVVDLHLFCLSSSAIEVLFFFV